jgi:hypothetical protein
MRCCSGAGKAVPAEGETTRGSRGGRPPQHRHLQPRVGVAQAQFTAMRLRHQPAQVEPRPTPPLAACARAVGAVEGLRQMRQLVGWHAGPEVAHTQGQLAVGLAPNKDDGRLAPPQRRGARRFPAGCAAAGAAGSGRPARAAWRGPAAASRRCPGQREATAVSRARAGRSTSSACSALWPCGQAFAFKQAADQFAHLAQVAQQGAALGAVVQQFGVDTGAGQRAAQFVAHGQQQGALGVQHAAASWLAMVLMRSARSPSSSWRSHGMGLKNRPGQRPARRRRCPAAACRMRRTVRRPGREQPAGRQREPAKDTRPDACRAQRPGRSGCGGRRPCCAPDPSCGRRPASGSRRKVGRCGWLSNCTCGPSMRTVMGSRLRQRQRALRSGGLPICGRQAVHVVGHQRAWRKPANRLAAGAACPAGRPPWCPAPAARRAAPAGLDGLAPACACHALHTRTPANR